MRNHILDKPRLYACTFWVARHLPKPLLYGFARIIGALVFVFSRQDRENVRHNLDVIYNGSRPPAPRQKLLWSLFQNYAFYMVDFFRLLTMTMKESQAFAQLYDGRHHLDEALSKGRGVVLLTAHLGHWEIGGLGLRALGYPINVVTLKHNSYFTNRLINTMRNSHGIRVIELGGTIYETIELVRALKRGEVVAVLADRVFSDRSEVVSFFGRPVPFPVGPILLAMATRAPVVPAFSVMEAPGRYRGIIEPPLNLRNGSDRERSLIDNLQQVANVFERYIRLYPDQWYHVNRL